MYNKEVERRNPDLLFDWDDENTSHLARHKIDTSEAEELFRNDPVIRGHEVVDGEDRWTTVGVTLSLRTLVLVFTVRSKKLVIPSFKREGDEAAWWDKHRAEVEADLRVAMRDSKTISLSDVLAQAKRKKNLLPVTIRLASEDIATARQLADDKGIGYQTYIKLLLHQALQKEAGRQGRGLRK